MKTKYYIGFISALLLSGTPAKAQYADYGYHDNADAGIVINNYYDNYDYYYSSRINRFHRSYTTFSYYSPVFTETYWYTYNPYSRGISIYSGATIFNTGNITGYSLLSTGSFYYDYRMYDPFYYSFSFGGYPTWYYDSRLYDPYIYNYWYTPYEVRINFSYILPVHYQAWNNHCYPGYYHRYTDCRPVYHSGYSTHTDGRSANQEALTEKEFSGSRRQISGTSSRQSVLTQGNGRTSARESVSESNSYNSRSGNSQQNYQTNSRRSIPTAENRNTTVSLRTETRRSSSQTNSMSSGMNQPVVKREITDYKNQNRSLVAMAEPSVNVASQPYTERNRREGSSAEIRSRDVTGTSVPAINSRRESNVINSVERDTERKAGEVSGSKMNGRRK